MALPLLAPVVAVAHSSGGFIAAKVAADGSLIYIGGTMAASKGAALAAGVASVGKSIAIAAGSVVAGSAVIYEGVTSWLF